MGGYGMPGVVPMGGMGGPNNPNLMPIGGMGGGHMGGQQGGGMGGGGSGGPMAGNMGGGMDRGGGGGYGNQQPPGMGTGGQMSGMGGGGRKGDGILNLRVLATREEVHYLFGADETLLQQLRQQTGAGISCSDPGAHERVITFSGSVDTIFKAFSLACRKLWEFVRGLSEPNNPRPLVLRLAVPAQQCGSIIGKQGAKIKEIRDLTGAQINVSQESLPDSNERTVEIIGSGESCLQTAYHVACIMQETSIKGEVIPYMPKPLVMEPSWRPIILANDQAYIFEGNVAVLAPPHVVKSALAETPLGPMASSIPSFGAEAAAGPAHMNPVALMTAISTSQREKLAGGPGGPEVTREMRIENEAAGSVIGKGGQKVGEIRKISGAQVHISTEEEQTTEGERTVTLTGTPESVLLAQFLVQSNVDLFKKDQGGFLDSSHPGGGDSFRPPEGLGPMMGGPPGIPQRGERNKGPNQNYNGPPNQNFGGPRGGGANMGQRPPMQGGGGPMGGGGGDRGAFGRGGGGGRRSPQFEGGGGPPGGQVGPMGGHPGQGGAPGPRRGGGGGGGKQQQKQGGRRRN